MMYDKKGTCSGGMSITLADSDGRSVEGSVGGSLIAATPVQVRLFSYSVCLSLSMTCDFFFFIPLPVFIPLWSIL